MLEEQPPYVFVAWPAWRYGPNGEAAIFEEHEVIPEGWTETFQPEKSHEEEIEAVEASPAADEADGEEGRQEEGLLTFRRGRHPEIHEGQF